MNKKRFFTLLTSVLILIGTIIYTSSSVANTTPIVLDTKYPQVEIINKTNPDNDFSIKYPLFHMEKIDQIILSYIKKWNNKPIDITYNIVHYSQQTLSIQFTEQKATQPNHSTTHTLNINLSEGKIIKLADLFSTDNSEDYLTVLSDIAYNELKNNENITLLNKELKKATAPTLEHFHKFILLNDAIVFYVKLGDDIKDLQLAVSKNLLNDMLIDQYKSNDTNKDIVEDSTPANLVTELPKKELEIPLDQKVIALSFDDGPKKGTTDIILDALKNYDAHATFFVLGSMAEKNPELLTEMVNQGNEVGSHSWDHPHLTKMNDQKVKHQIDRTKSLIQNITGIEPTLFRPPYGSFDQSVCDLLGNAEVALWDIDTEDWKYRDKDHIVSTVMNNAADGRIVLMHDIYQTSAEAAVEIIHQLTSQGYKIVSVSELLEIKKHRELAA